MIIKAQFNAAFRGVQLDAKNTYGGYGPATYLLSLEEARELKEQIKKAIKEAESKGL